MHLSQVVCIQSYGIIHHATYAKKIQNNYYRSLVGRVLVCWYGQQEITLEKSEFDLCKTDILHRVIFSPW